MQRSGHMAMNDDPLRRRFTLSAHAAAAMANREISEEWVKRVLDQPAQIEPDVDDPTLRHALGRIAERERRVLRVVYNWTSDPWRIVTVYFDRTMRDKL